MEEVVCLRVPVVFTRVPIIFGDDGHETDPTRAPVTNHTVVPLKFARYSREGLATPDDDNIIMGEEKSYYLRTLKASGTLTPALGTGNVPPSGFAKSNFDDLQGWYQAESAVMQDPRYNTELTFHTLKEITRLFCYPRLGQAGHPVDDLVKGGCYCGNDVHIDDAAEEDYYDFYLLKVKVLMGTRYQVGKIILPPDYRSEEWTENPLLEDGKTVSCSVPRDSDGNIELNGITLQLRPIG